MTQRSPSQSVGSVSQEDFIRYPGLLTPGQELVVLDKPTLPYQVRVNSLGYRGANFPAEKRPGEFRVLAAGDSITYGDFVDDGETLPAYLEEALRTLYGNATVINSEGDETTLEEDDCVIVYGEDIAVDGGIHAPEHPSARNPR